MISDLKSLVMDLANKLAEEIEAKYPVDTRMMPTNARRYQQDMSLVNRAYEFLEKSDS